MAEADPDDWSGARVDRWVRMGARLERQLAPVADLLIESARLAPGERVLDVGCGLGPTTRAAAIAVGSSGSVTGLDISTEMLEAAAAASASSPSTDPVGTDSAQIRWINADATTWDATDASFDVVLSRFGVMFFDDPSRAFANLARTTAPGGRLCLAVWGHRERCDLFEVPLNAVLGHLEASGLMLRTPVPPADAGAFSLSDPQVVEDLLVGSGWSEPAVRAHRLDFQLGGGADPVEGSSVALELGPARLVLDGFDDDVVEGAKQAVATALSAHVTDGSVVLPAEVLVISAAR